MAYLAENFTLLSTGNGFNYYRYDTTDSLASVGAVGYLNNSDDSLNLQAGDLIRVVSWGTSVRSGVLVAEEVRIVTAIGAAGDITTRESPATTAFGRLTPQQFGAEGDGVADDTAAILAWLTACMTDGVSGYLPNGTYNITSTLDLVPNGNLEVEAAPFAIMKGKAAIGANPILNLLATTRETYTFKWLGGTFDNSEVPFSGATQSGTALSLVRVFKVRVDQVNFLALADFETSQAAPVSDSGITTVDCRYVTISNCYFRGQADAGVYISGNNTSSDVTDDGGQYSFYGNHFDRCSIGITSKREARNVTINGNTFHLCYCGVSFFFASAIVPPGHSTTVTGNAFYKCETPVDVRGSYGLVLSSNTIEDWGLRLDGVTERNQFAFRLLNARECVIIGNQFHLLDWNPSTAEAIRLDYSASVFPDQTCINNAVVGNTIKGGLYGIREISDAVNTGEGNHIWNNYVLGSGFGGTRQVSIDNANSKTNVLYAADDVYRMRMFTGQDEILRIQDGILDTFKLDVKQIVYPSNTVLTIASGAITANGYDCRVDTEGLAASDDLDTINGGSLGMQVRIRPNAGARTVVVKNGTGNITLAADVTLDEAWKSIVLQYDTALSAWVEVSRGGF